MIYPAIIIETDAHARNAFLAIAIIEAIVVFTMVNQCVGE